MEILFLKCHSTCPSLGIVTVSFHDYCGKKFGHIDGENVNKWSSVNIKCTGRTMVSGHTDYWNGTMFWSLWFVDLSQSISNQESHGTCLGSHPRSGKELRQVWVWEDTGKESCVVLATHGFCFFAVFCEASCREAMLSWLHWTPTLN